MRMNDLTRGRSCATTAARRPVDRPKQADEQVHTDQLQRQGGHHVEAQPRQYAQRQRVDHQVHQRFDNGARQQCVDWLDLPVGEDAAVGLDAIHQAHRQVLEEEVWDQAGDEKHRVLDAGDQPAAHEAQDGHHHHGVRQRLEHGPDGANPLPAHTLLHLAQHQREQHRALDLPCGAIAGSGRRDG